MALEIEKMLDETGWQLLNELQQNARLSYSELGQRVNLSAPAVAERIRRLEEAGIISGYHAEVNLHKLGLPVTAIIRLGSIPGHSCGHVVARVSEIPEVFECYRVAGTDSVVARVIATSVEHLEKVIDQLSTYGSPTTSLIISKPRSKRIVTHSLIERGETT